jgi:hypothetical protein
MIYTTRPFELDGTTSEFLEYEFSSLGVARLLHVFGCQTPILGHYEIDLQAGRHGATLRREDLGTDDVARILSTEGRTADEELDMPR